MRAHIAFFLPLCVLWSCSVVNGQWASLLRGKKEETGTAALDSTSNEPQLILYRVLSTDGSSRVLPEKPPSCCRCDDCDDYHCECLCSCGDDDDDKSAKGGSSKGDDNDSTSSKGSKGSKGGSGNDDDDNSSSKGSKGSKSGSGDDNDDDGSKSKSSKESKGGSGDDDDDSSSSKGSSKGSKGGYGDDDDDNGDNDDDHDKGDGDDDDKGDDDDDDDNGDDDKDDDSYSSKGSKGDDDDDRYGSKGSKGDDDDDGYGSKGSKGDDDDVGISSKGSKGNDDDGYGSKGSKGDDDDDGYGSKGSKGDDDDGYSSKGSNGSRGDDDDDNDDDKGDDDDDKGDDDDDDDKGDDDDDDDDKGDDDDGDDKGDDDDGGCSGSKIKIVAPNKLENLDGLDGSDLSFCLEAFNETDLRQQNFYSSDQFQDLSGPMLITKVALRVTRIFGPPQVTGPIITPQKVTFDAEFRLSTTPVGGLQGLSTTFSENYGKNGVTTVLRDKTWELKTEGNNPDLEEGVPNPFDIFIKLDTPYLYDPSKGNLNFEYIIRRLETINCSLPPIAAGETNMLGPYIDAPPSVSPGDDLFNKVRLLYSFDVTSPVGLFEEAAPVARFTFEDPSCN